ncbi:hypothetical protein L211DRAFT_837669 [Terfezia boudieri ATCC MYA-4762]|uniref:Uncharacterized protein n=1 Tax=Terfezia boudieri ATCC MYA-4762 TaxID=1051890 RepID=A0A3N4LMZ1_9PEZI|nr:hypothetical protein L211DRAFT_837669 [Terfezia boudieri ATCC MYA-4762]
MYRYCLACFSSAMVSCFILVSLDSGSRHKSIKRIPLLPSLDLESHNRVIIEGFRNLLLVIRCYYGNDLLVNKNSYTLKYNYTK